MNKTGMMPVILIIIFLIFLYGVIQLFAMRFESGDVYPEYSSLRSDPMGAMAFFESLDKIEGLTVSRNYKSLLKVPDTHQKATLFYVGMPADGLQFMDKEEVEKLETLIASGWQTVIFLNPNYMTDKKYRKDSVREISYDRSNTEENLSEGNHSEDAEDKAAPEGNKDSGIISLFDRWGLDLSSDQLNDDDEKDQSVPGMLASDEYALPDSFARHSGLYFQNLDDQWQTVYSIDGQPVMIEKYVGKGKVILSSDSYIASNEAMWREPHPELLVWLVNSNNNAIFDETHLGIQEKPGIAALSRRYRLHGLFGGVLLLALLFIWKNATCLVPPLIEAEDDQNMPAEGKDSLSGFTNLLRRNIPYRDLLKTCFQQWERTNLHRKKYLKEEFEKIREVMEYEEGLPSKQQNPVKAYQAMSRILSERKIT